MPSSSSSSDDDLCGEMDTDSDQPAPPMRGKITSFDPDLYNAQLLDLCARVSILEIHGASLVQSHGLFVNRFANLDNWNKKLPGNLHSLSIRSCDVLSQGGCEMVVGLLLRSRDTLDNLSFTYALCDLDEEVPVSFHQILHSISQCHVLRSLTFSGFSFGSVGASILPEALGGKTCQVLNLVDNDVKDWGSFFENENILSLTELNISSNTLNSQSACKLSAFLQQPHSSLKSLKLSDHMKISFEKCGGVARWGTTVTVTDGDDDW